MHLRVGGWHCSDVHAWKIGFEHCKLKRMPILIIKNSNFYCTQRSSSKGLICGSGLSITLLSGDVIHCNDTEVSLFYTMRMINFTNTIAGSRDHSYLPEKMSRPLTSTIPSPGFSWWKKKYFSTRLQQPKICMLTTTSLFQAVFQTLCRLQICTNHFISGPGVMITASQMSPCVECTF